MTTDDGTVYLVESTVEQASNHLIGFYISEPKAPVTSNSNPSFTIGHIFLTVFSLAVIAFCIWMIVDCAKRKIKKKALWIILILLGVSFTVTVSTGSFHSKFMIGLFCSFSSLRSDWSTMVLTLCIPVGAIVYFALRKKLTLAELPSQQPVETEESATQPQEETSTDVNSDSLDCQASSHEDEE